LTNHVLKSEDNDIKFEEELRCLLSSEVESNDSYIQKAKLKRWQ